METSTSVAMIPIRKMVMEDTFGRMGVPMRVDSLTMLSINYSMQTREGSINISRRKRNQRILGRWKFAFHRERLEEGSGSGRPTPQKIFESLRCKPECNEEVLKC